MHAHTLRPGTHRAARDAVTLAVFLALVAAGCSSGFEPPPGTPDMSGTWSGAAASVTLTLKVGPIQPCSGLCLPDSGPITGGSYTDATLGVRGSIPAGGWGYYVVTCDQCVLSPDIKDWSVYVLASNEVAFYGRFTSGTTLVGTVYVSKIGADSVTIAGDSAAITLVKQ
jgi:hypothetical protein